MDEHNSGAGGAAGHMAGDSKSWEREGLFRREIGSGHCDFDFDGLKKGHQETLVRQRTGRGESISNT